MKMKVWIPILVVVVAAGVLLYVQAGKNQPLTNTNTVQTNSDIQVSQPLANATVTSPLTVTGQAIGGWYFEGSFPVKLLNNSNQVIAQAPAQAQSDWMVSGPVPFELTLMFPTQPAGSSGTLVFEKDNPSGLPQNAGSYSVNVVF